MATVTNIFIYIFLFISLYYETFLVLTYIERRDTMKSEAARTKRGILSYPSVTIIVPCWNEEDTLVKTVNSLLDLDYPKDKLKIMIIDDGSTDNSWNVIQTVLGNSQVEAYHKENGGKHTALNFGLARTTSDLVGGLDADSYVERDALKNMIPYFEEDKVMAVTPSVKVWKPKTMIQLIQRVEYSWGIFLRKMLSYLGALYVTPGPFSIFRREVFAVLGGYRQAYLTEDMEMAMRMQSHKYKIVNAHNAVIHTVTPNTLKKLYKQRLRWTYGFIKNVMDYRYIFFKREYGNLGIFILPMATVSIFSAIYVLGMGIITMTKTLATEYVKITTIGFSFHSPWNFEWFYINTEFIAILSTLAFCGTVILVLLARKMTDGKIRLGFDLLYFLTLYTFIAPLWLGKAVYNAVFSVKTSWR